MTYQTAPMPFVTHSSGSLTDAVNLPLNGINGEDVATYDWSIVKVEHNNVSCWLFFIFFVDYFDKLLGLLGVQVAVFVFVVLFKNFKDWFSGLELLKADFATNHLWLGFIDPSRILYVSIFEGAGSHFIPSPKLL